MTDTSQEENPNGSDGPVLKGSAAATSQAKATSDPVTTNAPRTLGPAALTVVVPALLTTAASLSLIFGGCCSNVFALEKIIKVEPASGTLLTFVQFLFVAVTSYGSQFDRNRPPFFLKPNKVPLTRWWVNIVLFFGVSLLNNMAFGYRISVPVHIILRSGGSIATMLVGYAWGKQYSRPQILSVVVLTAGVITAAWCDAQTKQSSNTVDSKLASSDASSERSHFGTGLLILFVAQTLTAVMGLYTEETYRKYGAHWKENLFYSHVLSLPLFIPFLPELARRMKQFLQSPPLIPDCLGEKPKWGQGWGSGQVDLCSMFISRLPNQVVYLVLNVLTQYVCIRGVNLLAATSTALTVTIVLNIRKLVSLLLSIWVFGHNLAPGTLFGALVVFSAGALYSMSPRPESPPRKEGARGAPRDVITSSSTSGHKDAKLKD